MILYESRFDAASVGGMTIRIRQLVRGLVEDSRRLVNMVRELADNAIFHSGEGGGYCLVERADSQLRVVVRDRGMGIHARLAELFADISERDAVRRVFRGGVSATADPDRGIDLKMVLDHTRQGPSVLVETGGVAFVGVGGRGRLIGKSSQTVEGVTATLTLPLKAR